MSRGLVSVREDRDQSWTKKRKAAQNIMIEHNLIQNFKPRRKNMA
jgi:hypothetical protein